MASITAKCVAQRLLTKDTNRGGATFSMFGQPRRVFFSMRWKKNHPHNMRRIAHSLPSHHYIYGDQGELVNAPECWKADHDLHKCSTMSFFGATPKDYVDAFPVVCSRRPHIDPGQPSLGSGAPWMRFTIQPQPLGELFPSLIHICVRLFILRKP